MFIFIKYIYTMFTYSNRNQTTVIKIFKLFSTVLAHSLNFMTRHLIFLDCL
jgi:hypothetical protein